MIEIIQQSAIQVDIKLGMPNGDLLFTGHIVEMPAGWRLVNEETDEVIAQLGAQPNSLVALTVALALLTQGVPHG